MSLLSGVDVVGKRVFKVLLAFYLCLLEISSWALQTGREEQSQNHKKYKFSICALFKNEERFLKEWIEYHKLIGVDHFYLYDNESCDRSRDVLVPYIKEGLITLIYWPDRIIDRDPEHSAHWALGTQLTAYENAAKYTALNDTDWLVFMDVDEYLLPVYANTITEVLDRYAEESGLQLTCNFFDASHVEGLAKRTLLIETVELIGSPKKNIQKSVEKTIFKPEWHTTVSWPPFKCNFKDSKVAVKLSKNELRINKYENRYRGLLHFEKAKEKLFIDNRILTENEIKDLLEIGFEIDDSERSIYRFRSELKKRMNVETIWGW